MKRKIFKTILVLLFAIFFVGGVYLIVTAFKIDWLVALNTIIGFIGVIVSVIMEYNLTNNK